MDEEGDGREHGGKKQGSAERGALVNRRQHLERGGTLLDGVLGWQAELLHLWIN
jgi:hypothetical protein